MLFGIGATPSLNRVQSPSPEFPKSRPIRLPEEIEARVNRIIAGEETVDFVRFEFPPLLRFWNNSEG